MKAYVLNKYGKNEQLQLNKVEIPEMGAHDVLVEIHAAGLNVLDSKI